MQSPPSSIIFSVGGFDFHYYGLIMFIAIIVALFVIKLVAKKYYKDIDTNVILDILPPIILSAILGARLYYVLLDINYYSKHVMEIFAVWHGGMSIHGAIVGGVLSGLYLAKRMNFPFLKYADIFSYGLLIGQSIGRLGNWFNCEAFGKPCTLPFVKLYIPEQYRPVGFESFEYFHPTFLYESLWNLFVLCILLLVRHKVGNLRDGTIFFSYLILYSIGRFFIEICRTDSVLNIGVVPIAQIVSLLIIIISLCFLYSIHKTKC